ncbi:MAG: acyl-CoA dehydrogenase family protein [Thermomicrobiales bacterium]
MKTTVDNDLIEAARAIGPLIRDHADEAERERRPPRAVFDALADAGFLRMLTPRSLGGLEIDPITFARIMEEVSGFDSAAGWVLQIGNSADWWCCRMPTEGTEEIYAGNPNALIAAAFHPPMQATEVPGGYRVTGRGPLASNIHDADWLMVTALIMDGDQPRMTGGAPEVIALVCRAGEAEIIDTWYALGMRGTDSNDVALADVFVPTSRTFPLVPEFEPGAHYRGSLYRFPAMGEVGVVLAPVALAVARSAITELIALAQRKTPFGSAKPLRERTQAQTRIAMAEATLRSARCLFFDTLSEAWERTLAGEPASLEQRADLLLAATHAVSSAAKTVELVYATAGTSAIYTRSRIERHFRDAQVLKQHGFLSESRYETVGQVYLGVPPEYGFVAF